MARKTRTNRSPDFKGKVALAAVQSQQTTAPLANAPRRASDPDHTVAITYVPSNSLFFARFSPCRAMREHRPAALDHAQVPCLGCETAAVAALQGYGRAFDR